MKTSETFNENRSKVNHAENDPLHLLVINLGESSLGSLTYFRLRD